MMRLMISGLYTAASFIASLVIISIIIRSAPVDGQVGFFLFQAIFFVLTTVMSQTYALGTFHGLKNGVKNIRLDLLAVGIVFLYLWVLGKGQFSRVEQVAYALATVFFYRGASLLVAVQYLSENRAAFLWVPISVAALRIVVAWFLREYEPAIIFAGSALVNFLIPFLVLVFGVVKLGLSSRIEPTNEIPQVLTTLLFFLLAALTFQWDRVVYALFDASESLLLTGYVMTVILSPLATLFATVYRGNAAQIFSITESRMRRQQMLRIGGVFTAAASCYMLLLVFFWEDVMHLLGVSKVPPSEWALLLGIAVVIDRLSALSVFLSGEELRYRQATLIKIVLITLGTNFSYWYGLTDVGYFYVLFAVLAIVHAMLLAILGRRKARLDIYDKG